MWVGRSWLGLLAWVRDGQWLSCSVVRRRAARERVCELLAPERLARLSWRELTESICRAGTVARHAGGPLSDEELAALGPVELAERIASGDIVLSGNQLMDTDQGAHNAALPGMDDRELEGVRSGLRALLHQVDDPVAMVDELAEGGGPLSASCGSLCLCLLRPDRFGVWQHTRLTGAKKLAWLLGSEAHWSRRYHSYRAFNELLVEIRDHSRGVLTDLLAVDALLCQLAAMREPRCWKVAIALSQSDTEADALAARCLRRGFAAVAGAADGDDANVRRLRQVLPGDYVVMHLRGRIGGVGRVVRPYYRLDPDRAGVLDREWWHRIDVDWIPGDRSYGTLLTGAQQRFTVVPLGERVFWQLAEMYEDAPDYGQVLRPHRGAWVIGCDAARRRGLVGVEKPLPLRDHWRVEQPAEPIRIGDTVLLFGGGERGGVCGVAKVIGVLSEPPRGTRVDLLHEHWFDRPLPPSVLAGDERTAGCERTLKSALPGPDQAAVVRLSGGQTAAIRELLNLPEDRYFVLMVGPQLRPPLRRRVSYRYSHHCAGQPGELTDAVHWARANCLIYHGAPDHAFAGFGPVIDAQDNHDLPDAERSVTITVAAQRFTASAPAGPLAAAWRRRATCQTTGLDPAHSITVLPISARDYYRVVASGLGVSPTASTAPDIAALAEDCSIPVQVAQELERLLRERGQMIFYGPPGTGKTWIALRLAEYLAGGDPQRHEVVQFHPAYSYEDFIEGIRPEPVEGPDGRTEISYPVVPGVFVRFCERARLDPRNSYVFVIDEINRAQISKVFGELMLLLEYRGRSARLASSRPEADPDDGVAVEPEGFSVPGNLLVLGTMNTADRSIALVDHALRRRFAFYPFFPDDDVFLRPMLRTWLARNVPEMLWVADLLDQVNARLADDVGRGLLIGPSYFMRSDLNEERLREVWRFQIAPLLAEYFAGMPEGLDDYDLDRLIAGVRGPDYPLLGRDEPAGESE